LSPSEALTGRELNRRDGIILLLTHNMQSWADTFVVSLDAFVQVTFGAGCDQPRANMARVY
jgi:hypothetical protein